MIMWLYACESWAAHLQLVREISGLFAGDGCWFSIHAGVRWYTGFVSWILLPVLMVTELVSWPSGCCVLLESGLQTKASMAQNPGIFGCRMMVITKLFKQKRKDCQPASLYRLTNQSSLTQITEPRRNIFRKTNTKQSATNLVLFFDKIKREWWLWEAKHQASQGIFAERARKLLPSYASPILLDRISCGLPVDQWNDGLDCCARLSFPPWSWRREAILLYGKQVCVLLHIYVHLLSSKYYW